MVLMNSERKFHRLSLSGVSINGSVNKDDLSRVFKAFKKFGPHARELHINCSFQESDYRRILCTSLKIRKLTISNGFEPPSRTLSLFPRSNSDLRELTRLKYLKIDRCDAEIGKIFLSLPNVVKDLVVVNIPVKLLVEIVARQRRLQSLTVIDKAVSGRSLELMQNLGRHLVLKKLVLNLNVHKEPGAADSELSLLYRNPTIALEESSSEIDAAADRFEIESDSSSIGAYPNEDEVLSIDLMVSKILENQKNLRHLEIRVPTLGHNVCEAVSRLNLKTLVLQVASRPPTNFRKILVSKPINKLTLYGPSSSCAFYNCYFRDLPQLQISRYLNLK